MRIKNWNVDSDELTRDRTVRVKRFRQTTVKQPRNTRRDRLAATRQLVELGLTSDQVREG